MKKIIALMLVSCCLLSSCVTDQYGNSHVDSGMLAAGIGVAAVAGLAVAAYNDDDYDNYHHGHYYNHYSGHRGGYHGGHHGGGHCR